MESELNEMMREDAKVLIKHAIDQGVPVEWYFHHLKGYVFKITETTHSDIDFLLSRGDQAKEWYNNKIKEYNRRIPIFGKERAIPDPSDVTVSEVLALVGKGIEHCPDRSHCLHVLDLAETSEGRVELEKEISKG